MITTLTIFFTSLYSVFLLLCLYYWNKLKISSVKEEKKPVKVAVIVPVRNEEYNIESILIALGKQNYSHFEVILADDHSTDDTTTIAKRWIAAHPSLNARCVLSNGRSKKDAISYAIGHTQSELILTTDADCRMGPEWISSIVSHFKNTGSYLIAAPVIMKSDNRIIAKIQSAEYAGLTAIGAAGIRAGIPMYCSGANLAFMREKFIEVNGYAESKSASGDDTQLMRKIAGRWPEKISFVKDFNASVHTLTSANIDLFEQRRRWASKIPSTLSAFTIAVAVLAWLVHAMLLLMLVICIIRHEYIPITVILLIKVFSEMVFLVPVSKFMKQKLPVGLIILVQPLYAIYIVVVGAISPFTKFKWKGRVNR